MEMVMKENELLSEIGRIVRSADGLGPALRRVQALIAGQYGGALLIIRPVSSGTSLPPAPALYDFLESREFPFRALYTAPLNPGNRAAGTLVACIGTWGAQADLLRRVTNFVGQQLTDLA